MGRGGGKAGGTRVIARIVGFTGAALIAVVTYGRLAAPEPMSTLAALALIVVFGLLGIATFIAVVLAWRARTRVLAVVVPVVLLVGAAVAAAAEPLHWRWSRADFAAVRAGADVRCVPATECRLGWWRVQSSQRFDEMVIVWLASSDRCDAGLGVAMPRNDDDDAEAVAVSARSIDGPSELVSVDYWREGWYELCFVS